MPDSPPKDVSKNKSLSEHVKSSESTKTDESKDNAMLFKNWFLNALKDAEVRDVIKQITAEAVVGVKVQVPDSTRTIELERELRTKDRSLEKAQADRQEFVRQHERDQESLKSARNDLKKFQVFSVVSDAYDAYKSLSPESRRAIESIVNGKDLLVFACSGVQESNLDRFWDVCNEYFIEGEREAQSLAKVFDAFFSLAQSLGTINSIERLSVESGDRFDNDFCTRISHSAPTGNVKEVLFQGYRYKSNRKIVKKTLVRV